jgi:hypothetical protein
MSRSRKKNPYYGNAGDRSQKFEKRLSHKSMRQAEQRAIRDESGINPDVKDVSNTWGWRKDGKHRIAPENRTVLMRK